MTRLIDLTGQKFGRLLVIKRVDSPEHIKYKRVHWLCRCECSNEKIISSKHLSDNSTQSCGCLHSDVIRKPFGEANANRLYGQYQRDAKRRNYVFKLTKKYFLKMTKQNCSYCGEHPSYIMESDDSYGAYIYNGIDRKNPKEGYIRRNCVPCCLICNDAKGTMDYDDFLKWLEKASNHSIKKTT